MAKKKKKQQKSSRKEYGQSIQTQRKELVQQCYNFCHKQVNRRLQKSSRLLDGMDFDPIRLKRRINATIDSMDEVYRKVAGICEDVPDLFSVAEEWSNINAMGAPAYDCEEEESTASLGAAIWILDQLRESGHIREAIQLMPKDDGSLDEIYLPPIWDPCHSDEVHLGMLFIIQKRNADCVGAKPVKRNPGDPEVLERFFMDTLTAEGKHKQDVPSRNRWEKILSMLPKDAVDRAVAYYEEVYWDWVTRFFACRNIFLQQEIQLRDERNTFFENLKTKTDAIMQRQQEMRKNPPKLDTFSFQPTASMSSLPLPANTPMAELLRLKATMEAQEEAFDYREEVLYDGIADLPGILRYNYSTDFWNMEEVLGEEIGGKEIAAVWKDFSTDRPYELLFAHLYLLDSGSDLPWLYFPGVSLFSKAARELPWSHSDYDDECDGIWYHWDNDADDVLPGPADRLIPKRAKVPELENWYRMDYVDRTMDSEFSFNRFNLSQIIFEITGGIMPRNLERYLPALADLDRFNINGKKTLHPLMYVMSLLGEGRRQSQDWRLEMGDSLIDGDWTDAAEYDETESPEELKRKITELRSQLDHAKKAAYESSREVREEKKRREKLEQKLAMERQELSDLRELVFNQQENLYQDDTPDEGISFPYRTTLRAVVFGGHDSWAREIKPKLPDVRFVDRETIPNADLIRHADVVWVQTNALSHAFFYKIIDEVRKYNIPLRYFSFASATKCAEQLAKYDEAYCT